MLNQGASFWNALNLESIDFTSQDRDILVLPMFHIGGIGLFTLPMLYHGATVVIMRTFDPAECLRLLTREKITLFFGVPAIFQFLIRHPDFNPRGLSGRADGHERRGALCRAAWSGNTTRPGSPCSKVLA